MGDKVILNTQEVIDIADAIRTKTKNNSTMKIGDMPSKIQSISGSLKPLCGVWLPVAPLFNLSATLYYVDENGTLVSYYFNKYEIGKKHFDIPKDSIIVCTSPSTDIIFDSTAIYANTSHAQILNKNTVFVSGSVTFEYEEGSMPE